MELLTARSTGKLQVQEKSVNDLIKNSKVVLSSTWWKNLEGDDERNLGVEFVRELYSRFWKEGINYGVSTDEEIDKTNAKLNIESDPVTGDDLVPNKTKVIFEENDINPDEQGRVAQNEELNERLEELKDECGPIRKKYGLTRELEQYDVESPDKDQL